MFLSNKDSKLYIKRKRKYNIWVINLLPYPIEKAQLIRIIMILGIVGLKSRRSPIPYSYFYEMKKPLGYLKSEKLPQMLQFKT